VWIRVWREDLVLLCSIRGDSRGFDSNQARASHGQKGLGLVAIEERVTAISRTLELEIESHSGYGTELSIRLPLEGGHANSDCAR
jgi:signal transduction histidine kinase